MRDAERQEELHGPHGVGANCRILLVGDGIATQLRQQCLDGKDKAVQRRVVRNVLDLAADGLVRERGLGLAGLELLPTRNYFIVSLLDEVAPRRRNGCWVAVVGGVVDDKAKVIVSRLVCIVIEQLQCVSACTL